MIKIDKNNNEPKLPLLYMLGIFTNTANTNTYTDPCRISTKKCCIQFETTIGCGKVTYLIQLNKLQNYISRDKIVEL